ncbi:arylsulfotransferase family protein [Streptomyces sp. NBC_01296]|uniref:arylsulfotransferase family protein n=1 Tax=Streptomyces sp. NBC_01296 TaxID=2903816 RepID=UPI002E15052B|nr:arylsulfotransferase family protein [Streptomyces sp. NBC_01296]
MPSSGERLFLLSPSASYPRPFACVIDDQARLVHAWASPIGQPDIETRPPSYLRGWNHVELGPDGSLYAMVPLHTLLKLAPDSTLTWRADLPVHHDLDISPNGEIYVLTEEPRPVPCTGGQHLLLDNSITVLGPDGQLRDAHSLYETLTTDPALAAMITEAIDHHRAAGRIADPAALAPRLEGPNGWLRGREISRFLRARPGSPSDILHTNTLEILTTAHPAGLWAAGDVLVSLRNLDLIAVLDLTTRTVRWWWGPGELSGQHQPSVQPDATILVFDNGRAHGRSRILQVEPRTRTVPWQHNLGLFCEMAGGCERLPDGNILISDAQAGRGLIINHQGQEQWSVQVATKATVEGRSRAEFYRLAAVHPSATARLGEGDLPARTLAEAKVSFRLGTPVRSAL